MNRFSISQLEQFSGIKAHTIRMWEKRYNALKPNRSEGNTRHYNNKQFRRLLNITSLLDNGHKVSELCSMEDEELFNLIQADLNNIHTYDNAGYWISQLISAGMLFDEPYFEKLFANCLLRYDLKNLYAKIIYPMLNRIGLMWANNTIPPAQEHFISNLVRQKILAAIDSLPPPSSENSWLLFLPEDELHEIGLLFSHYMIRSAGNKVYYLGSNLPLESLTSAVKEINPNNLLLFFVHNDAMENRQKYLNSLTTNFKKQKIFISGNKKSIEPLKTGRNITWISSVEELQEAVIS